MYDRDKEMDRILDYLNDLSRINIKYAPIDGDKIDK